MGFPYRKWAFRGLRLALFVGVLFAGHDAITRYLTWSEMEARNLESMRGYSCAALLSDQDLIAKQNEFGTINVRSFQCANRDFFVSMSEIREVRAGTMDFSNSFPTFDLVSTFSAGLVGAVMVALIVAAALVCVWVLRWIWGSRAAE